MFVGVDCFCCCLFFCVETFEGKVGDGVSGNLEVEGLLFLVVWAVVVVVVMASHTVSLEGSNCSCCLWSSSLGHWSDGSDDGRVAVFVGLCSFSAVFLLFVVVVHK